MESFVAHVRCVLMPLTEIPANIRRSVLGQQGLLQKAEDFSRVRSVHVPLFEKGQPVKHLFVIFFDKLHNRFGRTRLLSSKLIAWKCKYLESRIVIDKFW
ncbi:hypothetical protein MPSEU_000274900 [Mayamaea pseudoterrestris]|nr:hypothetical protein MPSEU_000274900 [Mayamaea pseudoterrestris]